MAEMTAMRKEQIFNYPMNFITKSHQKRDQNKEQSPICLLILVYTKDSIQIGLEMGLLLPPHYFCHIL